MRTHKTTPTHTHTLQAHTKSCWQCVFRLTCALLWHFLIGLFVSIIPAYWTEMVNPLSHTQGGGKESKRDKQWKRERWILVRPALGVLWITQLYKAWTGLAGRQQNTQVVHVCRHQRAAEGPVEHQHLLEGLSWPSPLTNGLLDLPRCPRTRLQLCVCECCNCG